MKKYIVIGGYVHSIIGEDRHYVNAQQLCSLYSVNPDDCYLLEENNPNYEMRLRGLPDLPKLYPRFNGDYSL